MNRNPSTKYTFSTEQELKWIKMSDEIYDIPMASEKI